MSTNILISITKTSFLYTIEFILLLLIFGIIFTFIEKRNSRAIINVFGRKGLIITGLVGTVVHEFSHIIFCIIFRHEIVEFSLFRPFKSKYDGIMGYVNHRCNIKNPYQRVGNFFIGVSPIIIGTLMIIMSMWLILPNEFSLVKNSFDKNMIYMSNINNVVDSFNIYINLIISIISSLNPFKVTNYIAYIFFIYIMYSITTHMDLSIEDMKNSMSGFVLFFFLIFITNFIFMYLGHIYFIEYLKIVITVTSFLSVSLIFAIITLILSSIIELFFS